MDRKYQPSVFTKAAYKNKRLKRIEYTIYIIILIFVAFNVTGFYIGSKVFNQFFQPDTNKSIDQYEKYKNTFDEKKYNSMQNLITDYAVRSTHGYNLHLMYIKNSTVTKNTVIIVHDLGGSVWSIMQYANMYIDKGYNVVLLDLRDHGQSGGKNVSYGYYEKDDLDNIVTWVYENKNKNQGIIGVHGIGLGAATAMMQTQFNEKNHRVKFYIIDSPYTTLSDYIKLQISTYYGFNKTILHKITPIENGLLNLALLYTNKYGTTFKSSFPIKEVSPLNCSKISTAPTMFICGDSDLTANKNMCKTMYDNTKAAKDLYLSPNAAHGNSYDKNKIEYMNRVYKFIDSNVK